MKNIFIVRESFKIVFLLFALNSNSQILRSDSLVLADIYDSLNLEGCNTPFLVDWDLQEPITSWSRPPVDVQNGRVTGLDIFQPCFELRFLPASIVELDSLRILKTGELTISTHLVDYERVFKLPLEMLGIGDYVGQSFSTIGNIKNTIVELNLRYPLDSAGFLFLDDAIYDFTNLNRLVLLGNFSGVLSERIIELSEVKSLQIENTRIGGQVTFFSGNVKIC